MARILMLLQEYFPRDTRVRKESLALVEQGHEVDILCLRGEGEKEKEEIQGIRVLRLGPAKRRGSKLRYMYEYLNFFVACSREVNRRAKSQHIDVVHVHTLPDFLVFASWAAKRRGAKIVLDLHEIMPEFFASKYLLQESAILIRMLKWIEQSSLEYSDYVITVNRQLKAVFGRRARLRHEIVEIMNTVNDDILPRRTKVDTGKCIGIYHGTITKLYNLEFAIRAIAVIKDQIPNFEFHIYGDGTDVKSLSMTVSELGLNDVVKLMGRVDFEKIAEALASADIGILPIARDIMTDLSFSNKLGEYVHFGIPVISTRLNGVMDYFSEDSICFFEDQHTDQFNEHLLYLYNNEKARKRLAQSARSEYESISWDVMKLRLQKLYSQITNDLASSV